MARSRPSLPGRPEDGLPPDPVIEAYKRDVDRSLLRENLKRTPQERFERLIELQRFAGELRRAGARERADG